MVFDFKRFLSGLILVISVFASFYFKLDLFFFILIILMSIYDLAYSKIVNYKIFIIFFVISFFSFYFLNKINFEFEVFQILFLFLILISIFDYRRINIYFTFLLIIFFIIFFYNFNIERNSIYLLILISFINDTSAYVFGSLLKGPKIIPKISPNKTWSGTLFSFFISFFIFYFLKFPIIISFFLSIFFFIGDIYFSFIKRKNKLTDFSNLISGHGGILDRLDSIFFNIVIINFYLINYL